MSINIVEDDLWKGLSPSGSLDVDVPLLYLFIAGKCEISNRELRTIAEYADKALEWILTWVHGVDTGAGTGLLRRSKTESTWYMNTAQPVAATADYSLYKAIAGVATKLGDEAVDLTAPQVLLVKVSCLGAAIKAFRADMTTPKISVTDTSIASGTIVLFDTLRYYTDTTPTVGGRWTLAGPEYTATLRAASTPDPKALAYFEVPIIGMGTEKDPFRAEVPEEIVEVALPTPKYAKKKRDILKAKGWTTEELKAFIPEAFPTKKINRVALTWSAHIPSDPKTGKPLHGTAIIRVFQSNTPGMRTIPERIKAFTEMPKSVRLTRDEAIKIALERDDKLFIHDLVPCTKHAESPTSKCCKEYVEWREKNIGLKRDLIDGKLMSRYVKEDKW